MQLKKSTKTSLLQFGAIAGLVGSIFLTNTSTPPMASPSHLVVRTVASSSESLRSKEELTQLLAKMFDRIQSARNLSDSERLRQAAEKVSDAKTALELKNIFEKEPERFRSARQEALAHTPIHSNGKTFVVSGLSASGSAAAMMAAHAGYNVTGFEARDKFSRNIQWTGRQCIIDTLAVIDQDMSDQFVKDLVRPIHQEFDLVNNKVKVIVPLHEARRGDPTQVPDEPGAMLNQDTVMLMQTKAVEKFMMDALRKTPNVDIRFGKTAVPVKNGKSFELPGLGTPDLIVVAEGTGSKTRQAMGAEHAPTSPARLQIAGELKVEFNGGLAFNEEHVTYKDGAKDILLTSAISNAGSGANWSVTDVPRDLNLEPKGLEPDSDAYKVEKQKLVNDYYAHALSNVLRKPETEVKSMTIAGPIENGQPTPFLLQQNMSRTAVYGDNAVGLGDAVGNAHWNVGGGVHIAMVSHLRRLANLMFDLEMGRNRQAAMKEYNEKVLSDSMEWGRRGITDFYPGYDQETVRKEFDRAVRQWLDHKTTKSPNEILQSKMATISSKAVSDSHQRVIGETCEGVFAH